MRLSTVILLLLMSVIAAAKNAPAADDAGMENIQKMQSCISNIDQEQFKVIEKRQSQFDAEMKSLCDSGKRDEAQKKAIMYEKEMMNNPVIKALSKCGEIAKGIMPEMPFMNQEEQLPDEHVCDSY